MKHSIHCFIKQVVGISFSKKKKKKLYDFIYLFIYFNMVWLRIIAGLVVLMYNVVTLKLCMSVLLGIR